MAWPARLLPLLSLVLTLPVSADEGGPWPAIEVVPPEETSDAVAEPDEAPAPEWKASGFWFLEPSIGLSLTDTPGLSFSLPFGLGLNASAVFGEFTYVNVRRHGEDAGGAYTLEQSYAGAALGFRLGFGRETFSLWAELSLGGGVAMARLERADRPPRSAIEGTLIAGAGIGGSIRIHRNLSLVARIRLSAQSAVLIEEDIAYSVQGFTGLQIRLGQNHD